MACRQAGRQAGIRAGRLSDGGRAVDQSLSYGSLTDIQRNFRRVGGRAGAQTDRQAGRSCTGLRVKK